MFFWHDVCYINNGHSTTQTSPPQSGRIYVICIFCPIFFVLLTRRGLLWTVDKGAANCTKSQFWEQFQLLIF